ncbi:MAG: hypothetical protein IH986_04060 [Planctomycetes bacterium]|nr:hypothetical protein [Planctomycetota bacterium]
MIAPMTAKQTEVAIKAKQLPKNRRSLFIAVVLAKLTASATGCIQAGIIARSASTVDGGWARAGRREEELSRLGLADTGFRGDIETIVAKALEKDRELRYQSAAELGADLRRFVLNRWYIVFLLFSESAWVTISHRPGRADQSLGRCLAGECLLGSLGAPAVLSFQGSVFGPSGTRRLRLGV